ncbi:MAG: class I SAM-dependent methyltransferase [Pseudomonadota bacterium]
MGKPTVYSDYWWPKKGLLERVYSHPVALDGGGKELVEQIIKGFSKPTVLEIGVFLGGSTIRWLDAHPRCTVVGVDLFEDSWDRIIERYRTQNKPWMAKVLSDVEDVQGLIDSLQEFGSLNCALRNLIEYRGRFFPVVGDFRQLCEELASSIKPDVIFLDADKSEALLELCAEHFPAAILTGDDWTWGADQGYPIQKAVNAYCERHGVGHKVDRATWAIGI